MSREHFRKTRTNYFYKHLFGISNTNLQNGISNTSAFKKAIGISNTNCIGTLNTNWYLKYQLVLQIPIGTSNTNWYLKYQLVPQIPIGTFIPISTSNTNWYSKKR
jgi:hypothetical protein